MSEEADPPATENAALPSTEDPNVEIHKPKPVHSWREFLKEYAIIVLGVLTALAAEQTAEWLHWREQVGQAREVIATEMATNVQGAILRIRAEPCIEHRLDAVADILDAASKTGSLPPVGNIGQAPALVWPSGAWESVVASQTATHFPREQLAALARLYKLLERADSFNIAERQAWSTLYTMVGPGRRLDPASEAQLRDALSLARLSNRMLLTSAAGVMTAAKGEDLPYSAADLNGIATAKRAPATGTDTRNNRYGVALALICDPIGPVPPRYGQSQNALYQSLYGLYLQAVPDFGDGAKIPAP